MLQIHFFTFNPTQTFLHLKIFLLLTHCGAWTTILVIILLYNDYFLKYLLRYLLKIIFLYYHIKIIKKLLKILIWIKVKNKISNFQNFKVFLKCQNKHVLIRKFNSISNEKKYHYPTFLQYKKFPSIVFSLLYEKN
jgi:hypothetical protein